MRQRSKAWFLFFYLSPPLAEQRIFRPSVSGASCQRSFFFLPHPYPFCWDIIPLSQWVFTRLNEFIGKAWCKRTEGWVDLRRGRKTMWGHSTDQLSRGSFPKCPLMFAFLMWLLSHCTDDKIFGWPEVAPDVVGHHSDCSLILCGEGCSLSFSFCTQCLLSSNRGTAGVRDCLSVLFMWGFKSYLAKQKFCAGFLKRHQQRQ